MKKLFLTSAFIFAIFFIACEQEIPEFNKSNEETPSTSTYREIGTHFNHQICNFRVVADLVDTRNLDFPKDNIQDTPLHSLDSFLQNTKRGKKYIELYDKISQSIYENTNAFSNSELLDIITVLPEFYTLYNNLNNSSYNGVIIDENFKNSIVNIANNIYKPKRLNDEDFNTNIDQILNDLITVVGMNRQELLNYLQ